MNLTKTNLRKVKVFQNDLYLSIIKLKKNVYLINQKMCNNF